MKKLFSIMFMAMVAMVCVTTFTACGGSDDDDTLGSDYSDITIGSHRIDVEFEGNTTPWTTTVGFSAVKASASGMGAQLYEVRTPSAVTQSAPMTDARHCAVFSISARTLIPLHWSLSPSA